MSPPQRPHRLLVGAAIAIVALAMWPLRDAVRWYRQPFAGILVDPDGLVSNYGLPTWDGFQQGLRYPDRIVTVDGHDLAAEAAALGGYRAAAWDRAVAAAAAASPPRPTLHVRVATPHEDRELDLRITPFDPVAFALLGVATIAIALLYVTGAFVALAASPRGRLSRSFAKTTLFAALFLATLFDYHTTRRFVPLFHVAFAMVPVGLFMLPLRLPDDVAWLRRHPWVVGALDALGAALALAMVLAGLTGHPTAGLRSVCTVLFGAGFFFFAVTFLGRFLRARGDRRATMRALLVAMVPAHVVLGVGAVLSSLELWGATSALLAVPALALTPLSSVVALIRHDLWGSRALLSRVLMRIVIVVVTCAAAIALGTGLAWIFGVPFAGALLASAVTGVVAGLLVEPALRFGDDALFPSRAVYKPTIEQLSEELTVITVPEEVAHAVERTVRRWLPCENVEFRPLPARPGEPGTDPPEGLPHGDSPDVSGIHAVVVRRTTRPPPAHTEPPSASAKEPAPAEELSFEVLFHGSPLAVLRVGKKRGGALFTSEDLDLLRTIGNQAALALAHAYSYAELELRRRQQAAAWRGEREALVETVAAEIAHEVRYPINYFRSIFRRGQGDLRLDAEDVDIGCDEVERLERLVSGLRRVTARRIERQRVPVEELVVKAERLLRDQLGGRALEVDLGEGASLRCDSDQVTQVLVNLLANALDAAGDEGRVGVAWSAPARAPSAPSPAPGAALGSLAAAGAALMTTGGVLTVWDTGPGFEGDPARVFAPWYTTKPRGTGLGLAITHRLVRAHGWTIEPARRDGRTLFVIEIPSSDVAPVHDGGLGPHPPGGEGRAMEVA